MRTLRDSLHVKKNNKYIVVLLIYILNFQIKVLKLRYGNIIDK